MATIQQLDRTNDLLSQIWVKLTTNEGESYPILVDIETNTQTTASNTTQSASDITAIALNIDSIKTTIEALNDRHILENWDLIVGNSKVTTYYTGVAVGNPSGSTDNAETIQYNQGASTVLTQTYTWNIDNKPISITAS